MEILDVFFWWMSLRFLIWYIDIFLELVKYIKLYFVYDSWLILDIILNILILLKMGKIKVILFYFLFLVFCD